MPLVAKNTPDRTFLTDFPLTSGYDRVRWYSVTDLPSRIIEEWPAALAVAVLVVSHVYLVIVLERDLTPLGIPLIAAIVVFLVAEVARRLVREL